MKIRLLLNVSSRHLVFISVACFISINAWSYSCGSVVVRSPAISDSGEYSIAYVKNGEAIEYTLSQHSNFVASFQYSFLQPRYQKLLDDGTYAAIESTSCYGDSGDRLSAHIYVIDREGSLVFSVESRNLLDDDYLEQLRSTHNPPGAPTPYASAVGAPTPWFHSIEIVGEGIEDAKFIARLQNYDQLEIPLNTGKGQYIHIADLKDDASAWSFRANWYNSLGEYEEATLHNHRALELAPDKHYVRNNLMRRYSQMKEYKKARELVEEALQLWPLTAVGLNKVDPFSEAARTLGDPLFYQLKLVELQQKMGNKDEVIILLDEILAHNPNEWEANKLKATLEIDQKNRDQILERLQAVFNHNISYLEVNDSAEGKLEFKGIYRFDEFYRGYAEWLSKHEFYKEAEEVLLAQTSEADPRANYPVDDSQAIQNFKALAENAKKQGNNQSALSYLIQATKHSRWDKHLRTQIAWMYLEGDGVDVDQSEARKWFIDSVNINGRGAKYFPICYLSYLSAETDTKDWCQKGVENKEADSAFWLALILLKEADSTELPAVLFAKVEALLNFAAENDYPSYGRSERVDFDIFELGAEVLKLIPYLRNIAERGSVIASFHLGGLYDEGVGVEQDNGQASAWFKKAAAAGHIESQYRLGRNLLGSNVDEALSWLESAANADHAWAAYELGEIYYEGAVVEQDYAAMEAWLLMADERMQKDYELSASLSFLSYLVYGRKTFAMKRLEEFRSAIAAQTLVE